MRADVPFRILSLDGGGVRGLVTAIILERLENKLQKYEPHKPLLDYFDVIAGTSTGSLIACALAKGLKAREIKDFYIHNSQNIFPPSRIFIHSIFNLIRLGSTQPIYSDEGLRMVLKYIFENMTFGDLIKPTIVTSYDTYNRQAVVFKNTKVAHQTIPVWEICRASSAAPIGFPGYEMKHRAFLEDWQKNGYAIPPQSGIPLIDGGVFANNPALCAIAERLRWNNNLPDNPKWNDLISENVQQNDIVVASFGTGQHIKKIGAKQVKQWGALEWLSPRDDLPLLDVLFDGAGDAVCYIAEQIIGSTYFRFQPNFNQSIPTFSAQQQNIDAMIKCTEKYLSQPKVDCKLDKLVEILNPSIRCLV
ncbi:patatin-like phospholipase family protein [Plectonema cf. radiosum LEGE 06105]|uniref:Patatin-like phospholipase family protein n=1 Tax=Plectonema cf. radiosum LEGE 06105 TaxID=945769 RepID=A0A8J7K1Z8_9CYAN|nr:patatin-like phospholipase family protein [Plectonema radiosum]MBE9215146.1 patatin-like phospholipase family protein [Plectonema cf. radiosum LEGE 06105]